MDWEEQLWTHTSMVMVGTSNHSDAVMCSSAVTITTVIAIDCTADITRGPTPAPIWREADNAHVSRSDKRGEQCLMCGCIVDELALCLLSISSSSSSSLGSPTAAAAAMDVEPSPCDVERLRRDRDGGNTGTQGRLARCCCDDDGGRGM
ncbi:hypothetical protein PTSG_06429 [Salpingoeca rosetta]|uniref:Uncharacterized protein n=1 Tax=Salpingoeca rosetta (strain ATCC 50818 / BSB-021) TaxID=946362 RepID=F2UFS5_SALR5|nr:uncharacterized protein PTSG_06429 [Salpingoeca rosetta]EGD75353.1 hypothetical protein PTSG_06429 [Salpingoeca rosetta]|eukprot:XP_004991810.1 hypothetical protein PTSG_06429 [Salpingoeca rosetta]